MPPEQTPSPHYDGTPHRFRLLSGTRLTRLHSTEFSVTEFNPTVARNPLQGGRFDSSPDDPYSFLYAALDDRTAVSETLFRDLPFDDRGARLSPRAKLSGLRIGWMNVAVDLDLVDLRSGRSLAAVGQDTWLTGGPASAYGMSRRWAAAIRSWAPWASGLAWRSRREPEGFALVLFGDRVSDNCLEATEDASPLPIGERDLSGGVGALYLEQILADYRVALM